jgi:ParB family chromosome partitioning protein
LASVDKSKKAAEPRRVLGRGLDALLPAATANAAARVEHEFQRVPIERLRPQKGQPRKRFDDGALAELAESIRAQGLIQPIIARKIQGSEALEIVAGERRWRAAQQAGLHEVPVVIKDVTPSTAFELALVENLQRMDLDPIEVSDAYQRLIDEYGYTQESLAARVGKNRATVANTLRLRQLPESIRERVGSGELSEGHARAILSARDEGEMVRLARDAVAKKWSVRETEAAARKAPKSAASTSAEGKAGARAAATPKSANVRDVEKKLSAALGMAVVIRDDASQSSGVVEIAYDSLDQFDRFLARILGE